MRIKIAIATYLAALAMFAAFSFTGAADCRGNNHFTGSSSPPPQHQANVCTK